MKSITQKILLAGLFLFISSFTLQAQVMVMQYRSVAPEDRAEFIKRETTYWSAIAKKAIDDGKMLSWQLWEKVGGMYMDEDSPNFVFVNSFADKGALDKMGEIWNASAVFPNKKMENMETSSMSHVVHSIITEIGLSVGTGGQFARVNYDKVTDWALYRKREGGIWKPFIEQAMKDKKTSVKGWNAIGVVMPRGTSMPFDAFTVDFFDTMSEAAMPTFAEDLDFPDFEDTDDSFTRTKIQIYRLIKGVSKE
ncbi:MAG: hypothetical protein Sapg2KO_37620 [Saprospiraceae bacterium]